MIKNFIATLFFCFLVVFVKGQDIHFSQYNGSLGNLSPGFTGLFNGDYRLNAIYRSQWQAVPVPYKTFSFAGDMRYKPKKLISDCLGFGILFNNDMAGDAFYGFNQFYLNASYIHKLNKDSTLLLSTGINFGISSVGFQYNQMTFDSQFDGGNYNSSYSTNEAFKQTRSTYADLNAGLALQYAITKEVNATYAFSINHFNNPLISYQANSTSKLDSKFVNYLNVVFPVAKNMSMIGEFVYSRQGKYYECIPGLNLRLMFDHVTNNAASLGIYYRVKDAVIARLGYTYKTTTAGISYDLNTSKFLAATNRRGAFEIYVTHIIKRIKPIVTKKRVCPVFM